MSPTWKPRFRDKEGIREGMTFERAKEVYDGDDVKEETPAPWGGFWEELHLRRLDILTRILEDIGVNETTTILDVGSGNSMISAVVGPMGVGCQITAFDVSTTAIEKGKKLYPDTTFLIGDAQKPEIEGQWDVVFAGEIIEHLPEPRLAFQRWNQRVSPGGYLVISTPNANHNIFTEEHISLQQPEQIQEIYRTNDLEMAGIIGADLAVPLFVVGPFAKIGLVKVFNHMLSMGIGRGFVKRYIDSVENEIGLASDIFYWGRKAES